jgi:magnesium chelatase subunit H
MPRRTSAPDATPIRVVIVTLDTHLASAAEQAERTLREELPGLRLSLHAATEWNRDPEALERAKEDIAQGDIVIASMLFTEDQVQAVLDDLRARRDDCDALICAMSAGDVMRLTRLGGFKMDGSSTSGPMKIIKNLKGGKKSGQSAGKQQVAMLRKIPKILRYIPGTAQDVRAYFMVLQYMLAGSETNLTNMVRFLVNRYADGARQHLRGTLSPRDPEEYPETGVYHPRMRGRVAARLRQLPRAKNARGRVGVLVMRSYVLAGNTAHYDAVIAALEARGLEVVPAFAAGLDSRPAVESFFMDNGKTNVDAVVSLTGFSLVGGPAFNDASAAEEMLAKLDVPYIAAQPTEFQTLEDWQDSDLGLLPVESTIMVAIPELDGATGSMLFGGRSTQVAPDQQRDMQPQPERVGTLADRVARIVRLRNTPPAERNLAIVLFNFPPNAGATGTAAYLSVYQSLYNTLHTLKDAGYAVDPPESVDALRTAITEGNAHRYGTNANVAAEIPVDDHVRREPHLKEIEAQWGPAPGKDLTNGRKIFVQGVYFGNVFVAVQPGFGYEGDPMRLLFEKGFAPTHAFSAFYRYLREDFDANAVLHFGTHGALEFMPGKQTALSDKCWPDRLIGDLPNFYFYASNNPSEGMVAKRRSAATLISYMTPPLARAGLYKELLSLKSSIERWRALPPESTREAAELASLIQTEAQELDLIPEQPYWNGHAGIEIEKLADEVSELENTLIPYGLHVIGEPPAAEQRAEMLGAMAEAGDQTVPPAAALNALSRGESTETAIAEGDMPRTDATKAQLGQLEKVDRQMATDTETGAMLHALDGGFIRPAPGGDLVRTPEVLPTGRNVHGFDPYRLPSTFAVHDGKRQADELLRRYDSDAQTVPETVALVLWGTDNLKTEGSAIGQALSLMGARPRFDSFNRLAGAELIPLAELEHPRIDVIVTLSGIFRDLLPLQTRMLAEAAYLAAAADEPAEHNYVRKHTLAYQEQQDTDFETAALRVFSNAEGAYGSNVNALIENGRWNDEDELAEAYNKRKCFAYGRSGNPAPKSELLNTMLSNVDMAYQNLDSAELGVTTIDHYFDTLGGISRAITKSRGENVPVYIGDQTKGKNRVRSLSEQVSLETRTRSLNPKWYESMLEHGYEGVRQIEAHITNTMGWSATTSQVESWVYDKLTETYVLDDEMRERLAAMNPAASARMANRLLEANERQYWTPDQSVLDALRQYGEELEDRLEGVAESAAA